MSLLSLGNKSEAGHDTNWTGSVMKVTALRDTHLMGIYLPYRPKQVLLLLLLLIGEQTLVSEQIAERQRKALYGPFATKQSRYSHLPKMATTLVHSCSIAIGNNSLLPKTFSSLPPTYFTDHSLANGQVCGGLISAHNQLIILHPKQMIILLDIIFSFKHSDITKVHW